MLAISSLTKSDPCITYSGGGGLDIFLDLNDPVPNPTVEVDALAVKPCWPAGPGDLDLLTSVLLALFLNPSSVGFAPNCIVDLGRPLSVEKRMPCVRGFADVSVVEDRVVEALMMLPSLVDGR